MFLPLSEVEVFNLLALFHFGGMSLSRTKNSINIM